MPSTNLAYAHERREDRAEVHFRTGAATDEGRSLMLLVVNISPNGLMARCDAAVEIGTRLTIVMPGRAAITGTVRWSLGGRVGCEFDGPIGPANYFALLPRLRG